MMEGGGQKKVTCCIGNILFCVCLKTFCFYITVHTHQKQQLVGSPESFQKYFKI